jgi:Casein kinase II regulatory subunit
MEHGRAIPNPRRLRPGQKFRWQDCKAAAGEASRDLGPTLPGRVLPALLFLSFVATGPSTVVLVAAREYSPRHHESMGRKSWQDSGPRTCASPPTYSSSSASASASSSSSAFEGADIRSVFRGFIEILQSCDGGGVDEYNAASDDEDDEQRVLDALEKLDRANGNQTQSLPTVSSSLPPPEYHLGLDDTRKYATAESSRQKKSKRRQRSTSIRTDTDRTELIRGAASIRNSTSLRQSRTGLSMNEPLGNATPDVASSPFKVTAPNIEVHPPTVSASQHPAVLSPSSSSSILLRQSRAAVREYLASCRAVDGLVDVPLDFLADPFNLAQLAPVVEEIGQFWLRRPLQQQRQSQQQSNEDLKAQSPAVAFPIYRQALHLLLTMESDDNEALDSTTIAPPPSTSHYHVEQAAVALYFLVHQRYVASPRGLECVRRLLLPQRHESSVDSDALPPAPITPVPAFGRCPNLSCRGMPLLPCGDIDRYTMIDLIDDPGRAHGISNVGHHAHDQQHPYSSTKQHHQPQQQYQHQSLVYANSRAKRYCPSCRQYFYHWRSRVDGCAWGPTFCHLFVMTQGGAAGTGIGDNWEDVPGRFGTRRGPAKYPAVSPSGAMLYDPPPPRIFGYRLHPGWYLSASDNWCRHWEQRSAAAAATATAASASAVQGATTAPPKPSQ